VAAIQCKGTEEGFADSVDDYLEFCSARGEDPKKPFSGNFLVRVPPEVHRQIMTEAKRQGKSLNAYVTEELADNTQKPQMEGMLSATARERIAAEQRKRWSENNRKKKPQAARRLVD
jgi:post-segregation antitoxin (ccd killing protein)